jgi:hypothetical protein
MTGSVSHPGTARESTPEGPAERELSSLLG